MIKNFVYRVNEMCIMPLIYSFLLSQGINYNIKPMDIIIKKKQNKFSLIFNYYYTIFFFFLIVIK